MGGTEKEKVFFRPPRPKVLYRFYNTHTYVYSMHTCMTATGPLKNERENTAATERKQPETD
jgi:hypothetical protein